MNTLSSPRHLAREVYGSTLRVLGPTQHGDAAVRDGAAASLTCVGLLAAYRFSDSTKFLLL